MCLALVSSAAGAQPAADPSRLDLRVKPLLCVLDRRTPACDLSFLVFWQSDESGDYCLFNDFTPDPLACWSGRATGEHTDERVVQSSFRYWMTFEGVDTELAAVTVEVLRLDTDDRRRRRRSRHVWDVL